MTNSKLVNISLILLFVGLLLMSGCKIEKISLSKDCQNVTGKFSESEIFWNGCQVMNSETRSLNNYDVSVYFPEQIVCQDGMHTYYVCNLHNNPKSK